MQSLELTIVDISWLLNAVQQASDPLIPLFDLVLQLMDVSFVVLTFLFSHTILLTKISLKVSLICSQSFKQLLVSRFKISYLTCMDFQQLLFQRKQLKLSFSFHLIDFVLKKCNFNLELLPIVTMIDCLSLDFSKQFRDLIVFDCDDFFETVELNTKHLSLVLKVLLHVLQLEIDHFLELFL